MKSPAIFAAIGVLMVIGAFLAPGVPFIVDGGIYHDMARAMAEQGVLFIGGNGGVENAPALTKLLTVDHNDLVYPQYPSGYALVAAPFYALFGLHGLILMNAVSFVLAVWLIYAFARRLFDERIARWSAGIFAIATFAPTYAYGIWPHMLALSFWLGAIYFAICANHEANRIAQIRGFVISGLLIGAGLNIRVDVILAALILFFWLRLFARPTDRLAPFYMMLGVIPGLLLAAWLNHVKFGDFTPFSYGSTGGGGDSVSRYQLIATSMGAVMLISWAFNLPAMTRIARSRQFRGYAYAFALVTLGVLLAISPIRDFVWRIASGLYVLVINLQAHDAYHQDGVLKNSYGQLLFWGYPKKALIQSVPWMVLAALPCIKLLHKRNHSEVGLCVLAIAAPLCFYAMSHWHGGGSYNMRYFLPALPFLSILAASGLVDILGAQPVTRRMTLVVLAGAGVLYVGLQEIGQHWEHLFVPAALYPQWVIALLLCGVIAWRFLLPVNRHGGILGAVALFSLAYAIAINLYEEIGHERTRAEQRTRAADISAPLPRGSFVISPMQTSLIPAEKRGVFVMAANKGTASRAAAAAEAFSKANRCVYFHNSLAVSVTKPFLNLPIEKDPIWAPSERFKGDPRLAFFLLSGAPAHCRFQRELP